MKNIAGILLVILLFGCSQKKESIKENKLYKQSEMAALMLEMYEVNLEYKVLILEGKSPKKFPNSFLKIHTATLTDSTDRNAAFKGFSEVYLYNLQQVFSTEKDSLISKHNNAINSCIACHKTTCIGPIPKIKKLLIP